MDILQYNKAVEELADKLYLFSCKRLSDHELARDIVQESYTRAWIRRESIDGDKIKSYLFTTCHHLIVDHHRQHSRFSSSNEIPEHTESQMSSDLKEIIDSALSRLSDIQRSVVLLRDYEGYNYHEIAELTGLNESQVKVYIFRARKSMKKYLGKLDLVL